MNASRQQEAIAMLWFILATLIYMTGVPMFLVWLIAAKGAFDIGRSVWMAVRDK